MHTMALNARKRKKAIKNSAMQIDREERRNCVASQTKLSNVLKKDVVVQDCICCSRRSFDSAPFHSHNKYLHNNLTTCESNLANSKFIVLIILNTYNIQLTHIPHIMVTAPMTFYHRVNYKSNNSFSFNIHILNFLAGFHFSVRPIQMIQNVNAPKEHSMNHHLLFRVSNSEIYTVYSSRNAYIYFLRMCVKCYTINKTKPKRKKPGDFRVNSLQIYI